MLLPLNMCVCVCVAEVDTLATSSSACFVLSLLAPVQKQYFPAAHFSTLVSNKLYEPSRASCKHCRVHSPPVSHMDLHNLVLFSFVLPAATSGLTS